MLNWFIFSGFYYKTIFLSARQLNSTIEDKMKKLTSIQAKFLRGIAHALKPVVFVGQKGVTQALIASTDEAFQRHELIKVKFIDFKEKEQKKEIAAVIENKTNSRLAGMIGHIAIFYKQHTDPDKRKIVIPN
jgi:RNA-binding protein